MKIRLLNKSAVTNYAAILLIIIGIYLPGGNSHLLQAGLFALSGALTNWLAVIMLFERIPFLYGSGVIPNQFAKFRDSIRRMIMDQFFTADNIHRFLRDKAQQKEFRFDFGPALDRIDYDKLFDKLLEAIKESKFGSMLSMIGGLSALEPLREPVKEKIRRYIEQLLESSGFQKIIDDQLQSTAFTRRLHENIEHIVVQRLNELTPQMVKEIVQRMIREHLGWLVVWGGVFGGLIGLVVSFTL